MLETTPPEALFHAEAAYHARFSVPQTKRYRVEEIVAHSVNQHDPARKEVEAFIYAVFKQSYGADIQHFMPELVALRDQNGVLMAAFGLRNAAVEALYLEHYLQTPIEHILDEKLGLKLSRKEIVCIGNLAVANPRNAGVLIAHVIQHCLENGVQWAVATAHHSLQNGLIKGGRDVYALCSAEQSALPVEEQDSWGNYYHHLPQVIAIRGNDTTTVN